jgi:hypothetical protein
MRWNCPHCQVALGISDDLLGTSYSFSRCFKCQGYALVRRGETNPIKVDQPPINEAILNQATAQLARRPLVKPAAPRRAPRAAVIPPKFNPKLVPTPQPIKLAVAPTPTPIVISNLNVAGPKFPEPLPDPKREKAVSRVFFTVMAVASLSAITSGAYLYIQGQSLWQKTHPSVSSQNVRPAIQTTQLSNVNAIVSDQVHQNAMAPSREVAPTPELAPLLVEAKVKNASLRSGPGLEYRILGYATPDLKYTVSEWNDRWFKIIVNTGAEKQTAWIRNDLVRLVSVN